MAEALDVDRLREKFPRASKALVQLYPMAWDQVLGVVEEAMHEGKTASVIAGKLSILRGLERSTRRWVVLSIQADRREIMLRKQKSFLTQLHDRSLDEILAELKHLEDQHGAGGATPTPPHDELRRGYTFISHHRVGEGRLAQRLAEGIETLGGSCWVAPRDVRAGLDWNDEVYGASQRCGALIYLHSAHAARSMHVKGEVHIAVGRGVPILVVKLFDGDPAAVNIGLAAYQHVDWIGRDSAEAGDLATLLHAALEQVAKADPRAA